MGTKIMDLIDPKDIAIDDLKGKILVFDAFNILYMFITTIRQSDGSLLKDSKGNITSHLSGLFSRINRLMQKGLKLAFVFDGKPPELKLMERKRRKELKKEARMKYEEARDAEDISEMKKFAGRTAKLTPELIEEAKLLIEYFGLPIIQAPSEGEAQAAHIVKKSDAYALVSQDADAMLFGTPLMVRNLSTTQRRKKTGTLAYQSISPQIIKLADVLNNLGLDQDQLIVLGILVGTDFNIGGIKGIGPKKALDLVKKYGRNFDDMFYEAKWKEHFDFDWKEVFNTIKNMPVTDDYRLEWQKPDKDKIVELMVDEHEFNRERIENTMEKLLKGQDNKQKGLSEFF